MPRIPRFEFCCLRFAAADVSARQSISLFVLTRLSVGLNLTMASRVIILDPWWNNAAEQQAFCRIYRIGQTQTTFMTRMCVRNTIDDRIMAMQKKKQEEIDEIMEDGGRTVKR